MLSSIGLTSVVVHIDSIGWLLSWSKASCLDTRGVSDIVSIATNISFEITVIAWGFVKLFLNRFFLCLSKLFLVLVFLAFNWIVVMLS